MSKFRKSPELRKLCDQLTAQLNAICSRRNLGFLLILCEPKGKGGAEHANSPTEVGSNFRREDTQELLSEAMAQIVASDHGGGLQ